MTEGRATTAPRRYHHGNLPEALVAEAVRMAATGGPDAVVLREVARRVGVSATAAYRHFDGQPALQHAVKEAALLRLADHMRAAAAEPAEDARDAPSKLAVQQLLAIGRAYFEFALDEGGLFRCFCMGLPVPDGELWDRDNGLDQPAFGILTQRLDDLVTSGAMPPERRDGAEIAVWSAVHGLAMLCLDGPFAAMPRPEQMRLLDATSQMLLHGILR